MQPLRTRGVVRAKAVKKKSPRYLTTVTLLCRRYGLAMPTAEFRFSPPRLWRFDFAWPASKVALEVDGGLWSKGRHSRASGIIKEHEKFNVAAALGWRVFRTTPQGLSSPTLWALLTTTTRELA